MLVKKEEEAWKGSDQTTDRWVQGHFWDVWVRCKLVRHAVIDVSV